MSKPKLEYFFEAEYYDGHIYKQNEQDSSIKFRPTVDANGELQGKSSFSDIQEDVQNNRIHRFFLVGKENRIGLDLATGIFYFNSVPFLVEHQKLPAKPKNFELIYYRQNTVDLNATYETKTGQMISAKQGQIFTEYFLGWKCTINGRPYEEKIAVA